MRTKGEDRIILSLRYERRDKLGRLLKFRRRDGANLEALGSMIALIGQQLKIGRSAADLQREIDAALKRIEEQRA